MSQHTTYNQLRIHDSTQMSYTPPSSRTRRISSPSSTTNIASSIPADLPTRTPVSSNVSGSTRMGSSQPAQQQGKKRQLSSIFRSMNEQASGFFDSLGLCCSTSYAQDQIHSEELEQQDNRYLVDCCVPQVEDVSPSANSILQCSSLIDKGDEAEDLQQEENPIQQESISHRPEKLLKPSYLSSRPIVGSSSSGDNPADSEQTTQQNNRYWMLKPSPSMGGATTTTSLTSPESEDELSQYTHSRSASNSSSTAVAQPLYAEQSMTFSLQDWQQRQQKQSNHLEEAHRNSQTRYEV